MKSSRRRLACFISVAICLALVGSSRVVISSAALGEPGRGQRGGAAPDPCAAPPNEIVAENCKPGNPSTEWDINAAGDPTIQGFATDMSVNLGETVAFKIKTDSPAYRLDIYRLGYYGGMGARQVVTIKPSVPLPQSAA